MFFRKLCKNSVIPVNHRNQTSDQEAVNENQAQRPLNNRSRPISSISDLFLHSNRNGFQQNDVQALNNNQPVNQVIRDTRSPPPSSFGENSVLGSYNPIISTPPPQYSPRRYNPTRAIHVQVIQPANREHHYAISSSSSSDESSAGGFFRSRSVSLGRSVRASQCPDLVHSCTLNTYTNQISDQNDRDQPSIADYAEIDELCVEISDLQSNSRLLNEGEIKNRPKCLKGSNEINGNQQAMGQNLSLRRPRMSMTWVLRDQQQSNSSNNSSDSKSTINEKKKLNNKNSNKIVSCTNNNSSSGGSSKEEQLITEKYVSNLNLQKEHQEKREPYKDLLFVCTPQKQPFMPPDGRFFASRRRSEIGKRNSTGPSSAKYADRILDRTFKASESAFEGFIDRIGDGAATDVTTTKCMKATYSEPSLIAVSEGEHRRHKHRKRRGERNRAQRFGYEIRNVDEFLSKCSLASPGNIPVVLSTSSTLYQTRPGGYQLEIPLPLGMVVNAVFKNENWLYVQTPHAEEGYVGYSSCLPLGILPPARSNKPPPCWETNGDIFPKPCGNITDSEKEFNLRGTRSDGARTPRPKKTSSNHRTFSNEHRVDRLYLRAAASQPKLTTEKSYPAQLRPTNKMKQLQQQYLENSVYRSTNEPQQYSQQHIQIRPKIIQNPCANLNNNCQNNYDINGQNSSSNNNNNNNSNNNNNVNNSPAGNQSHHHYVRKKNLLRQTLVAISNDYITDNITVNKGEIVTLMECRESKDKRQWFYIKTRDGREGYIPAEYAGHGFL